MMQLKATVNLATAPKQLNRECSLFTNDSRYVIVGAAAQLADEQRPPFYDLYTSNDGITPTLRYTCCFECERLYTTISFFFSS